MKMTVEDLEVALDRAFARIGKLEDRLDALEELKQHQ